MRHLLLTVVTCAVVYLKVFSGVYSEFYSEFYKVEDDIDYNSYMPVRHAFGLPMKIFPMSDVKEMRNTYLSALNVKMTTDNLVEFTINIDLYINSSDSFHFESLNFTIDGVQITWVSDSTDLNRLCGTFKLRTDSLAKFEPKLSNTNTQLMYFQCILEPNEICVNNQMHFPCFKCLFRTKVYGNSSNDLHEAIYKQMTDTISYSTGSANYHIDTLYGLFGDRKYYNL